MNIKYSYKSEDNKNFAVYFRKYEQRMLKVYFSDLSSKNKIFLSKYQLDDLNIKFKKLIQFKTIEEFIKVLVENINKKYLILNSPYKNAITSIWRVFPDSKDKIQTFTLSSSLDSNKSISLIFYSNFKTSEKLVKAIENSIQKESSKQTNELLYLKLSYDDHWLIENMYFLNGEYNNDEKKKTEDFLKLYKKAIENRGKDEEKRILLVFLDYPQLLESIKNIIEKLYMFQPFILIFTEKEKKFFKYEVKSKIYELLDEDEDEDDNEIFPFFDINNIFIYKNNEESYKKTIIPILKVYRYFNQLGDSFFRQLPELINIENLENDIQYLFHTHYFNILLCGKTGVGKSTFINTIMREKKSFTSKLKSAGTFRNNYYIHKRYPIKIIDVCGFAEGSEAKEIQKKLNAIFKQDSNDIIIDEPMNDIFTFYGDKRNNIHLLLYFNVYNDKYDILPGELPVIYEAVENKIPIVFIVNKCPKKILKKPKKLEKLKNEVKMAREDSDFKDNKTFYINCITKDGFDELLDGIYKEYEKNILKEENLERLKNSSIEKEEFNKIYKDSFFFGNIQPQDVFLNESLLNSVKDIKTLVVRLAAYYSHELGFWKSIGFYFFTKIYNNIKRDSESNFFPLLTNLVKKIYLNFGIDDKTEDDCNNYIKSKISEYFNIDVELEKEKLKEEKKRKKEIKGNEKDKGEKNKKDQKEKKEENKEMDKNEKKENKEQESKEKENKGKDNKKTKQNENKEKKEENEGKNKKENKTQIKGDEEVPPPIVQPERISLTPTSITPTTTEGGDPGFKLEDMVDEEELNDFIFEDVPPRHYEFTIEQFQKDFINLGKLYWNSEQNFQINDNIEEKYIMDGNNLEKDIFEIEDKKIIEPERLYQLVKRDFNLDESKRESTSKEKIILKLFYISYVCNELISELCGKINESGFKYKSICSFYYTVSKSYNDAINGFIKIKDSILNEKKNSIIYDTVMGGAAPSLGSSYKSKD